MKFLNILAALSLVLFVGCGGGSKEQQQNEGSSEQQEKAMSEDMNVRTIDIIGIDQMKYVVESEAEGITVGEPVGPDSLLQLESISVKPGEKIRIRLTTRSKLPATAMSHNFILLKNSANPEAFDKAATQARDNDYIPTDMTDQIIAHIPLTSGGETNEITLTAPEETGDYEFICSFPGHFTSGMKGTLSVGETTEPSM